VTAASTPGTDQCAVVGALVLLLTGALACSNAQPEQKPSGEAPAATVPAPQTGCTGSFAGRWKTPLGQLRMTVEGDQATGRYPGGIVTGRIVGNRLEATFKWRVMNGTIGYDLAPDGRSMVGNWKSSLGQKGTFVARCDGEDED
jgi:hypothetical protein